VGFRMRKSFSVIPGIRVNLSGKSVGVTVGGKLARTTLNSRTGTHSSYSLPGTGLSYSTAGAGRVTKPRAVPRTPPTPVRPTRPQAPPPPVQVRPGLLAPRGEKELYEALEADRYGELEGIASRHPELRHTCMVIDAFKRPDTPPTHHAVRAMFEELWASGYDPGADSFVHKYAPASYCSIGLAPGISVSLPLSRTSIGLVLAEFRQEDGDLAEAAAVVEGLEPSAVAAVSLAELYGMLERWNAVVDLTDNVTERDDLSIFLLIQRGAALRELHHFDAAREALKAALARRSQPVELRHHALLERGLTYAAEGKRALAKKDLEKILAEDGKFPGLAEALTSLCH
jgi:tetratricopeptide (TPR) repeat protein